MLSTTNPTWCSRRKSLSSGRLGGSMGNRSSQVLQNFGKRTQFGNLIEIHHHLEFFFDNIHQRDGRDRIPSVDRALRRGPHLVRRKVWKNRLKYFRQSCFYVFHAFLWLNSRPNRSLDRVPAVRKPVSSASWRHFASAPELNDRTTPADSPTWTEANVQCAEWFRE